jgi:excisionase family DNA binding protein
MPRAHKTPLWPVALSPARAAAVLGIRPDQIQEAIRAGHLPVYTIGIKRRVLIEDLVAYVRAHFTKGSRHVPPTK